MVRRMKDILILGIGNLLMGDEGIGVHVVRRLNEIGPKDIDIVDGGTGGFHLLEFFQNYKKILLIDATIDNQPPGTVTVLRPRFSSDYPPTLTAHDIGLKDLLDAVYLLDKQSDITLFAISISPLDKMGTELSPEVENRIPEIIKRILDYIQEMKK
ncbi:MAG: HyaD/HybD family hydrogenase maturation endopeptidase [Calditrichia bacterium]